MFSFACQPLWAEHALMPCPWTWGLWELGWLLGMRTLPLPSCSLPRLEAAVCQATPMQHSLRSPGLERSDKRLRVTGCIDCPPAHTYIPEREIGRGVTEIASTLLGDRQVPSIVQCHGRERGNTIVVIGGSLKTNTVRLRVLQTVLLAVVQSEVMGISIPVDTLIGQHQNLLANGVLNICGRHIAHQLAHRRASAGRVCHLQARTSLRSLASDLPELALLSRLWLEN